MARGDARDRRCVTAQHRPSLIRYVACEHARHQPDHRPPPREAHPRHGGADPEEHRLRDRRRVPARRGGRGAHLLRPGNEPDPPQCQPTRPRPRSARTGCHRQRPGPGGGRPPPKPRRRGRGCARDRICPRGLPRRGLPRRTMELGGDGVPREQLLAAHPRGGVRAGHAGIRRVDGRAHLRRAHRLAAL